MAYPFSIRKSLLPTCTNRYPSLSKTDAKLSIFSGWTSCSITIVFKWQTGFLIGSQVPLWGSWQFWQLVIDVLLLRKKAPPLGFEQGAKDFRCVLHHSSPERGQKALKEATVLNGENVNQKSGIAFKNKEYYIFKLFSVYSFCAVCNQSQHR